MSDRYFHLLERHQKLDAALRMARDPLDVLRLARLKAVVKAHLARLFLRRPEAVLATV
ncbi:MAG: DUF465 domain-containing protein [Novosphingobium sp. 17-62-19]|uniref:DUF465 domain-containing protein n=1 Tax=Novosphingobium sp. 17-62-19 TaxID=1970406 RepID=UPI000BCA3EC2|nr:DUF465 domain-containing protein [Novosphingobium sp. 17-62-19]OYX90957.1 MAG: DUF465 domain-containing protein [Novosphingobium sp. 35-62-5]OZA16835.1 MAG: DUF465 domain-containing protein [Novosphingobium sp. 17-62-19]HQS97233.1 DUF465 domain-containing protein [Novosphingobium sp.]